MLQGNGRHHTSDARRSEPCSVSKRPSHWRTMNTHRPDGALWLAVSCKFIQWIVRTQYYAYQVCKSCANLASFLLFWSHRLLLQLVASLLVASCMFYHSCEGGFRSTDSILLMSAVISYIKKEQCVCGERGLSNAAIISLADTACPGRTNISITTAR